MKKEMKNIFLAFLSLVNLLAFEVLNNADTIKQNLKIDLQTTSNTLLLILSTYSIWRMMVEIKQTQNHSMVHYLNNFLIVASAFLLNIYVFENEIVKISSIFNGWHAWWSVWFSILFLWLSGIGKSTFQMLINMGNSIGNGARGLNDWASNAIKNTHKGVIFSVASGLILWPVFGGIINVGRSEFSMESFFRESLVYWCGWFIVCMLIFFFISFSTKMGQAVNDIKSTSVMKFFIWMVLGAVSLFVALQVLPAIFPILGKILSVPIIVSLLTTAGVYFGKEKLKKSFLINWKDLVVVLGVIIVVTFVFLPTVGANTETGQSIMASNSTEDLKVFMELITAGLELIKEIM